RTGLEAHPTESCAILSCDSTARFMRRPLAGLPDEFETQERDVVLKRARAGELGDRRQDPIDVFPAVYAVFRDQRNQALLAEEPLGALRFREAVGVAEEEIARL